MLPYNDKSLVDVDACPDPRLLLPEILRKVGHVSRLKICEAEKTAHDYTDSEINKLKLIVATISSGVDSDTLVKLEKVAQLFRDLDTDGDGDLSEITDKLVQVTENTNDIQILKVANNSLITEITNLNNRLDVVEGRVDVLEKDAHAHEFESKTLICQLSKNIIQALQTGLDKFEEEMNKECVVVLNAISNTESTSTSTSTSTTSTTTGSHTSTTTADASADTTDGAIL